MSELGHQQVLDECRAFTSGALDRLEYELLSAEEPVHREPHPTGSGPLHT
jgi:hypothetical protein